MSKIDIRDLRVGNWVRITEPDNFAGAMVKISSLSNQKGAYFAVTVDDPEYGYYTRDVFCEDIEPISLTEEILIQNGFPEDEWHGSFPEDKKGLLYIVLSSNVSTVSSAINKIFWEFNDCRIEIKSVHQLQNILQDLGIEKEIKVW